MLPSASTYPRAVPLLTCVRNAHPPGLACLCCNLVSFYYRLPPVGYLALKAGCPFLFLDGYYVNTISDTAKHPLSPRNTSFLTNADYKQAVCRFLDETPASSLNTDRLEAHDQCALLACLITLIYGLRISETQAISSKHLTRFGLFMVPGKKQSAARLIHIPFSAAVLTSLISAPGIYTIFPKQYHAITSVWKKIFVVKKSLLGSPAPILHTGRHLLIQDINNVLGLNAAREIIGHRDVKNTILYILKRKEYHGENAKRNSRGTVG